jgi:hypothetical protein
VRLMVIMATLLLEILGAASRLSNALRSIYTAFVIELASRRVHIVGSTPFPNDLFMRQVARMLTAADHAWEVGHRVLICDRDAKWSARESV